MSSDEMTLLLCIVLVFRMFLALVLEPQPMAINLIVRSVFFHSMQPMAFRLFTVDVGAWANKILMSVVVICVLNMISSGEADLEDIVLLGCAILLPFVLDRLHRIRNEMQPLQERAKALAVENHLLSEALTEKRKQLELGGDRLLSEIRNSKSARSISS